MKKSRLEAIGLRNEKDDEIVTLLDLFGGKMTMTELLDLPIPLVYRLRDAKIRVAEKIKKHQEAESLTSSRQSKPATPAFKATKRLPQKGTHQ